MSSTRPSLKPGNRFRAAHSSFRLRMLQEQHAPNTTSEPDKEKNVQKKIHLKFATPTSDLASSAATASHHHRRESGEDIKLPPPLDLTKVISGNQRKILFGTGIAPQTPTNLSVDTAVETVLRKQMKKQVMRTASGNGSGESFKKRSLTCDDASLSLIPPPIAAPASSVAMSSEFTPTGIFTPSLMAGTSAFFGGVHSLVSPRNSAPTSHKNSAVIVSGGATSPGAPVPTGSSTAFQPPKSKFKMAHESFRIRMFQEQYGFEPVFMTKKRTADSKFSEFKAASGGDLNKYTAKSYTIKNGNEIFGGGCGTLED